MPEKRVREQARKDARKGRAPSTQAGEFVREEIEHVREGKHGARSTKQAIAIGLSKARRAGVKLRPPQKGRASERTRAQALRDYSRGQRSHRPRPSQRRSRAIGAALRREGRKAASHRALSRQARQRQTSQRSESKSCSSESCAHERQSRASKCSAKGSPYEGKEAINSYPLTRERFRETVT